MQDSNIEEDKFTMFLQYPESMWLLFTKVIQSPEQGREASKKQAYNFWYKINKMQS